MFLRDECTSGILQPCSCRIGSLNIYITILVLVWGTTLTHFSWNTSYFSSCKRKGGANEKVLVFIHVDWIRNYEEYVLTGACQKTSAHPRNVLYINKKEKPHCITLFCRVISVMERMKCVLMKGIVLFLSQQGGQRWWRGKGYKRRKVLMISKSSNSQIFAFHISKLPPLNKVLTEYFQSFFQ